MYDKIHYKLKKKIKIVLGNLKKKKKKKQAINENLMFQQSYGRKQIIKHTKEFHAWLTGCDNKQSDISINVDYIS